MKQLFALVTVLSMACSAAAQAPPAQKSLYERLGGYDAIAAVSDEFIKRLEVDKQVGRFFVGLSTDSKQRVRQHVVDFLCAATGGPCIYKGRDLKTAHAGIGLGEADWQAAVSNLNATLDKFGLKGPNRDELLAAFNSLKPQIVEAK